MTRGACICGDPEEVELMLLRDLERMVRRGSDHHIFWPQLDKLDQLRQHPDELYDPKCPVHGETSHDGDDP